MPTRLQAADRWWRMRVLSALRVMRNLGDRRLRRWRPAAFKGRVLAEVRSELWSTARPDEFMLTAGKVHNLRRAARAFNGVRVPGGRRLSFWRQLGRATRRRGFVPGRELQAGCVVPVVGGGLCQLSNAIATCAARAGMELVERHAHSVRPVGPDSAEMIDATVLWAYVDLQVQARHPWQLEVCLDDRWLIVRIRGEGADAVRPASAATFRADLPPAVRSCVSCGERSCFRHREDPASSPREVWLLDEDRPEWRRQRAGAHCPVEVFRAWTPHRREREGVAGEHPLRLVAWRGRAWRRWCARSAGRRQAAIIDAQRWLARAMARRLRPEHRHLVVDQALLPHLWMLGALGGRTFRVLAATLPMAEIQRRLDRAGERQPASAARAALHDFRIDPAIAEAELQSLRAARQVCTPHADVARYLRAMGVPVEVVPWSIPAAAPCGAPPHGDLPLLVFPASALARKGFHELLEALQGRAVRLRVLGAAGACPAGTGDVVIERGGYGGDGLQQATAVVLPAYVEHRPRALLQAVAAGVPVIASTACGVDALPGVEAVEAGDIEGLRAALDRLPGMTP